MSRDGAPSSEVTSGSGRRVHPAAQREVDVRRTSGPRDLITCPWGSRAWEDRAGTPEAKLQGERREGGRKRRKVNKGLVDFLKKSFATATSRGHDM